MMREEDKVLIDTPMGKRTWGDIRWGLRMVDRFRNQAELEFLRRSEIAKKAWAKRKQTQQGELK